MRFTASHLLLLGTSLVLPFQAVAAPCGAPGSGVKCSENGLLDLVPRFDVGTPGFPNLLSKRKALGKTQKASKAPKSSSKAPEATKASVVPGKTSQAQSPPVGASSTSTRAPGATSKSATPTQTSRSTAPTSTLGSTPRSSTSKSSKTSSTLGTSRSSISSSPSSSINCGASTSASTTKKGPSTRTAESKTSTATEGKSSTSTKSDSPTTTSSTQTTVSKSSASPSSTSTPSVCKRADGECSIIEKYRLKGVKSQQDYVDSLAKPGDHGDGRSVGVFYAISEKENQQPFEYETPTFVDDYPDVDWEDKPWKATLIENKPEDLQGKSPLPILKVFHRADVKTIMIDQSFGKKHDVRANADRIRWSNMVMDTWRRACNQPRSATDQRPMANPSELKYIVRWHIKESTTDDDDVSETHKLLEEIWKAKKNKLGENPPDEPRLVFQRDSTGKDQDYFLAIMGTPHGDRVNRMLGDYHVTMGNARIRSFDMSKPMENGVWSIVIELER